MERTCVCGAQIIGPADIPLQAAVHPLAIWREDGQQLTQAEIIRGYPPGHHLHECPGPRDHQQQLF